MFLQCRFRRVGGNEEATGWIEEEEAKLYNRVKLNGDVWILVKVETPPNLWEGILR